MRKIERLKGEAREAAEFRGHRLTRWLHYGTDLNRGHAFAGCENYNCKGYVTVEPRPLPNGIEIGGALVAVGCPALIDDTIDHINLCFPDMIDRLTDPRSVRRF